MQKADKKTSVARPRKSFVAIDLENSIEQPAWPEDGAPRWLHIDPVPASNHSAACDHRDKPGQKAVALSPLRPIAGCDRRRNSCSALFGTRSAGADRPKRAELGQRFEIRTSLHTRRFHLLAADSPVRQLARVRARNRHRARAPTAF